VLVPLRRKIPHGRLFAGGNQSDDTRGHLFEFARASPPAPLGCDWPTFNWIGGNLSTENRLVTNGGPTDSDAVSPPFGSSATFVYCVPRSSSLRSQGGRFGGVGYDRGYFCAARGGLSATTDEKRARVPGMG
jgi:hypothetical protein